MDNHDTKEEPEGALGREPAQGEEVGQAAGVKARFYTMLITLTATVMLAIMVGLWVMATGAYNVSAEEEHWPVTEWAVNTLQHRSVAARAEGLDVTIPDDPAAIDHGFEHFHAMCVECHGAPGFDRGETGQGLNPTPPRLEREAEEWTDAELFWITKHGIRLAGMPAFGPTHTDEEIAGIVAFLRSMETMTEEEYAEMVRALESGEALHEH